MASATARAAKMLERRTSRGFSLSANLALLGAAAGDMVKSVDRKTQVKRSDYVSETWIRSVMVSVT